MGNRIAAFFCWLLVVLLAGLAVTVHYTGVSAKCIPVIGLLLGVIAVLNRHHTLARQAEASQPQCGHDRKVRPSDVRAWHLGRGSGRLRVDAEGTVRFLADANTNLTALAWLGFNPTQVTLWQMVRRRLKAIFCKTFRQELQRQNRDLTIPRKHVRVALPFPGVVRGPSVVLGLDSCSGAGLEWEEFFLSELSDDRFFIPTADPGQWVRDLALPPPAPALEQQAREFRARCHHQVGSVETMVTMLFVGVVFLLIDIPVATWAVFADNWLVAGLVSVILSAVLLFLGGVFYLLGRA